MENEIKEETLKNDKEKSQTEAAEMSVFFFYCRELEQWVTFFLFNTYLKNRF